MKYLLFCLSLILLFSCDKSKESAGDIFINQLVDCTYEELYLPYLETTDILSLLNYKSDKTILCKYPANLLSSFYSDKVTVGMFALWTIESIRISELNNTDQPQARFPSLNPILSDIKDLTKDQSALQNIAAEKYQDWWSTNKSDSKKVKVNPLAETNLVWR